MPTVCHLTNTAVFWPVTVGLVQELVDTWQWGYIHHIWTEWTLAMVLEWWQYYKRLYYYSLHVDVFTWLPPALWHGYMPMEPPNVWPSVSIHNESWRSIPKDMSFLLGTL